MNTMTPAQVASNRTARLVREVTTPTYSTSTPPREHLTVVEMEHKQGGRSWSLPMRDSEVACYIDGFPESFYDVSDIDHAAKCWCQK